MKRGNEQANDFRDAVLATRVRLGWTQAQLADELGVTARSVRSWEHGQSVPWAMRSIRQRLRELQDEHGRPWDGRSLKGRKEA